MGANKASLPRRIRNKVRRMLGGGAANKQTADSKPKPEVVRERVVVRQLVLSEDEPKQPLDITELDCTSLLGKYALPSLSRMAPEEQRELVDPLLSLERMRNLGIDPKDLEFPEAQWKRIYNRVYAAVDGLGTGDEVAFNGSTASELNVVLAASEGKTIRVTSPQIELDTTIRIPSNVSLKGCGAQIARGKENVEKAFLLDEVQNASISGFVMDNCCGYPFYVKNSSWFVIEDSQISRCAYKAICVMGSNDQFVLANNRMEHTGNGAIFLNGDVHHGVIEGNIIDGVGGTGNFSGGIVLSALDVEDIDTAFNPWQCWDLTSRTVASHDLVFLRNTIQNCTANGLYSHASYCNYLVENVFQNNNKEGMCLDFGTCGCFVARNLFKRNGGRFNMDQQQLEEDFIQATGILPDGSSPAKVPGISLDNAAYNILYQNLVAENYGSGIKMVRSGVRNVILANQVIDNNVGQNDAFHFFGVELGTDLRPDYESGEIRELDFAPCFENIVARNVVSGGHYSGVFLGPQAYINDVFDNVIMESPRPIELISNKFNSIVNNH